MTMRSSALQVAGLALVAAVSWYRFLGLDGPEFSGGWLTGPLLNLQLGGTLLVTLALLVAFAYPRVSAAMTLAAVPCCLPLHLYFLAPGVFRGLFGGEYSVPMRSYFEFNSGDFWSVMALFGLALVSLSAVRKTEPV
jgi:hypothetical protein